MKKLMVLAALAAGLAASTASAETYQATNWMTPVHILNEETYQKFAKELAEDTGGDVNRDGTTNVEDLLLLLAGVRAAAPLFSAFSRV